MKHFQHAKNSHMHFPLSGCRAKTANRLLLVCLLALGLAACGGGGDGGSSSSSNDGAEAATESVTGAAQKGPFKPGASASAVRLVNDGSTSGAPVTATIDNNGAFDLPNLDWVGPTQLTVSGTFFDEFNGDFLGSVELHSAVMLNADANTNVNLFTHFVAARTQHLMAANTAFSEAREQARSDLAAIMGIEAAPNTLDLLHDDGDAAHEDDSANLLLFSAATLAAGIDQAGIDAIATDFADDGQINGVGQAAFGAIQQATEDYPDLLATARINLLNMYSLTPPNDTDGASPAWTPDAPAMPVAAFATSGSLKEGALQSFEADSSTGDTLTYSWNFGDGEAGTGVQTTHVYATAGTYTVVLTVTDRAARSDSKSRDLTITEITVTPEPPTSSFSVGGNRFTDQELTFDASDSMGSDLSYVWTFGDGMMGNGAQVTHSYTASGNYTVKLKVVDSANQTAETTEVLTITAIAELIVQSVTASDGEEQHSFGNSAAIDGDTAVIGAWYAKGSNANRQGAAYVFTRSNDGTWIEQAKLEANGGGFEFMFGRSVAISGDTIVVGEPARKGDRSDPNSGHGAAYVFTRAGNVWSQQQKLLPSNTSIDEGGFGSSVAIESDVVMVGRPYSTGFRVNGSAEGPYSGAVYVYQRSGNTWTQQTKLLPNGVAENEVVQDNRFGETLAFSGDTAVIGDIEDGPGAAYVFTQTGGNWSEQAKLTASDAVPTAETEFSKQIAIDGNTVVLSTTATGVLYVFTGSGANWSEQAKLRLSDEILPNYFGASVAITDDTIMATTAFNSANNEPAYVFTRSGNVWSEQPLRLKAGSNSNAHPNGGVVVFDGNTTLIGASYVGNKKGAAYFYDTSLFVQ